jgi:hypothetical protein
MTTKLTTTMMVLKTMMTMIRKATRKRFHAAFGPWIQSQHGFLGCKVVLVVVVMVVDFVVFVVFVGTEMTL